MVTVSVVGARGYLGRELVRLLLHHPSVEGVAPISGSGAGTPYGDAVPSFRGHGLTLQGPERAGDADVVLLATDAAEATARVAGLDGQLVIDLSRAHREAAFQPGSGWTYGLSELFPVAKGCRRIANPGCYPTASLLAAAPALRAGLAAPGAVIADGKSGVSGAGATPRPDLHFADQNESLRAYKVLGHDHQEEIRHALGAAGGMPRAVRFTPHLVPMTRGLLSTVYLPAAPDATPEAVRKAYLQAYAGSRFVRVVPEPDTGHVRHSNHADVAADLDLESGLIVARCAIDNLQKGGAGQAVQNMNLALGMPETQGLPAAGGFP